MWKERTGMKNRTRLAALGAALTLGAAVICGSSLWSEKTKEERGGAWSEDRPTLYFWYADQNLEEFVDSAAQAFGEREGVRVIPVLVSGSGYLEAVNEASLRSGQLPDVYLLGHDSLEKAYLAGLAARVQDGAGVCSEKNFPQAALSSVTYQGKLLGYPLYFETTALIYNRTCLQEWAAQMGGVVREELTATVEDILYMADTFDAPDGVESIFRWDTEDIFYNYWLGGAYISLGGENGDASGVVDIDNAKTARSLEAYRELARFFPSDTGSLWDAASADEDEFIAEVMAAGVAVPEGAAQSGSWEPEWADLPPELRDFCQGKLVFTVAATDAAGALKAAREAGKLGFEYGVCELPRVEGEQPGKPMSVTGVVAVNGFSTQKELAEKFAAYLTVECSDSLYDRTGRAAACLWGDRDNEILQAYKKVYENSVPLPKMMSAGSFWMELEGLFSRVRKGGDVQEQLRELQEGMEELAAAYFHRGGTQ